MAEGLLQSSYEREQVESVWEGRRKDGAIARGTSNHHPNVKDDAWKYSVRVGQSSVK